MAKLSFEDSFYYIIVSTIYTDFSRKIPQHYGSP